MRVFQAKAFEEHFRVAVGNVVSVFVRVEQQVRRVRDGDAAPPDRAPQLYSQGSGFLAEYIRGFERGQRVGIEPYEGGSVYCASKHAVRAIYEGMRLEVQDRRIRFTTVDPAMVQTDFSRVRFRGDQARADAAYDGMTPLTPEDIARAVVYAVTQPDHVNVGEMVIWSSAQASTTICQRD